MYQSQAKFGLKNQVYTTTVTSNTVTATVAARTDNKKHHAWLVSGHTDNAGLLQIKDGSTVIWETKLFAASGFSIELYGLISGSALTAMSAVLSSVTAAGSLTFVTVPLEDN